MSTPPSIPAGSSVPREVGEEFSRLLRMLAGFRGVGLGSRAVWPMVVVWLLSPTWPRAAVASFAYGVLYVLGRVRWGAQVTDGDEQRFVLFNAAYVSVLHGTLLALTGGVVSPLAPMMVVWSFVTSLFLGEGRLLWGLRTWYLLVVAVQTALTYGGVAARWAPGWLAPTSEPAPVAFTGAVLAVFVLVASRVAAGLRAVYLRGVWRVRHAQGALLESYAAHAEERSRFAAALAHELKNPLASIKGLAALLSHPATDERRAERLVVLRRETERLQGTLETMLAPGYATGPATRTLGDLRATVDEVVALFEGRSADAGVRFEVEGNGQCSFEWVTTRQILLNLLGNALEASPRRGVIRVRVAAAPPSLCIEDEGPGLEGDAVSRAFEPGVTTKPGGYGLGLSIARALAERQGATLGLYNASSGGVRAVLTFAEDA